MSDAGYDAVQVALYDQHADSRDRSDVGFYRDLAREADGPALEVACGTGRIYLELLADGLDVDGFDASAPALETLRERAAERDLCPSVWAADVTEFDADRSYALAYAPFNAVQHLLTVEDQLAALESVYQALAPGGTFAFDAFVPDFELVCEEYGEWSEQRVTYEGEPHVARRRSRLVDDVEQTMREDVDLRTTDGELVGESSFELAFLPRQQVELLARRSPFEDWSVAGGFDGEPIEGSTTQVWRLERAES